MIATTRRRGLRWAAAASGEASPGETSAADGEVVWSWRRDPGVYPRRPVLAGQRGQERPFPGEITYKPPNHCAGKAGMTWLYLSNPCALFCYPLHTVLAGAAGTRLSLRPLLQRAQRMCKTRAISSRGNADSRLLLRYPRMSATHDEIGMSVYRALGCRLSLILFPTSTQGRSKEQTVRRSPRWLRRAARICPRSKGRGMRRNSDSLPRRDWNPQTAARFSSGGDVASERYLESTSPSQRSSGAAGPSDLSTTGGEPSGPFRGSLRFVLGEGTGAHVGRQVLRGAEREAAKRVDGFKLRPVSIDPVLAGASALA